jgi:heme/copper-type cytochrome/quinol oxidase subunit 2
MAKLPGQASIFALLMSSAWTVTGLFVLIFGHLVIVFALYGRALDTNALAELERFIPFLKESYLFVLAGLAILLDIWIVYSVRAERKNKGSQKPI